MALRIIDHATVDRLLTYAVCIPLMRSAMTALSQGRTTQVLRQILRAGDDGVLGVMPGVVEETFGAKLISVYPGNFAKGLPSHQGGVLLFDGESGAPCALVHAGAITAIRTAAASAAATDALARPDAGRLAILGYGEQALTHALALSHVRPLREIRVWGRSAEKAAAFADRLSALLAIPVRPAPGVAQAVDGADLICAVTGAREPILHSADVAPGAHVNLAGASGLAAREADIELIARGRLFADHREGVLAQSGEFAAAREAGLVTDAHVLGEIGAVLAGDLAGRTGVADITLYKSLGSVVQDLYAAWRVYQLSLEAGLGADVPF